jgi:hypothetical protein
MCRVIDFESFKRNRVVRTMRQRESRFQSAVSPGMVRLGDVTADILRRLTE